MVCFFSLLYLLTHSLQLWSEDGFSTTWATAMLLFCFVHLWLCLKWAKQMQSCICGPHMGRMTESIQLNYSQPAQAPETKKWFGQKGIRLTRPLDWGQSKQHGCLDWPRQQTASKEFDIKASCISISNEETAALHLVTGSGGSQPSCMIPVWYIQQEQTDWAHSIWNGLWAMCVFFFKWWYSEISHLLGNQEVHIVETSLSVKWWNNRNRVFLEKTLSI